MALLRKQALFGLTAIGGLATLLLILTWGGRAPETQASNESADTVMSMVIEGTLDGSPVTCETPGDGACTLDDGSSFTVAMIPSTIPIGGYGFWQTKVSYGTLEYKPRPDASFEVTWDLSFLSLRFITEGTVSHGDARPGIPIPPLQTSSQKTVLVTLDMNCTSSDKLEMPPFDIDVSPTGALYGGEFFDDLFVPEVHSIDIDCQTPPTPTPCPAGKDALPGGGCGTPVPTPTATDTPTATPAPEFACGDVNGDEQVDSLDSLWILWLVAALIAEVPVPEVGDLNKDEAISAVDASLLLQFDVGLLSALTCHTPLA